MRTIGTIILLLISINLYAQNLAECGLNDNSELTQTESKFLNGYMNSEQRKGFDFTGKKVLFITGKRGEGIGNKSKYFDYVKEWDKSGNKIATWVVELNDDEKELIEKTDYDVIVTYWVKHLSKRRKRIILNELKTNI